MAATDTATPPANITAIPTCSRFICRRDMQASYANRARRVSIRAAEAAAAAVKTRNIHTGAIGSDIDDGSHPRTSWWPKPRLYRCVTLQGPTRPLSHILPINTKTMPINQIRPRDVVGRLVGQRATGNMAQLI